MICLAKKKSKIYKKFLLDIWGLHSVKAKCDLIQKKKKPNNFIKYFALIKKMRRDRWRFQNKRLVYQLRKVYRFNIPKRLKKKIFRLKLFRYFFLYFSKNMLLAWFEKSKKGIGFFMEKYLNFIEGNLMMLTYRFNFFFNLFSIPLKIKNGFFFVNDKVIYDYRKRLTLGDFFGIRFKYIGMFKEIYLINLKKGLFYQKGLDNFFEFRLFYFFFFFKFFVKKQIVYPVDVDILRVHDIFSDYR